MNKLALSALLVGGLFQATGCIITTDDDDSAGYVDVTWSVVACPTDGAVQIYAQDTLTQERFGDTHTCATGTTGTNPLVLPLGDYDVWAEIQSNDLSVVYGTSPSYAVSLLADGDTTAVAALPVYAEDGFFELKWTIATLGGGALSCTEANSGGVRVLATLANTTEGEVNIFNCEDGYGLTEPIRAGLYTVVVDVMDTADLSIAAFPSFTETAITDTIVDLRTFDFEFDL